MMFSSKTRAIDFARCRQFGGDAGNLDL